MPTKFLKKLRKLHRNKDGVTMIEYGLAAGLMSAAIVTFLSDLDNPDGLLGRIKLLIDGIFD
ncbi:MAG: Flp family type IVb pilin [Alphaproteobacteria bacterium]